MGWFAPRRDPKHVTRDAIVTLRSQLQMLEKKEEFLQKRIDEDLATAKTNAVKNKAAATAALRRKKAHETNLDQLSGIRIQVEQQINTLENANFNQETMTAMKKGADALKVIHGSMNPDRVDATLASINEQREIAEEISSAISNPLNSGIDFDESELASELAALEQDELNDRLRGAENAPRTVLPSLKEDSRTAIAADEDDEEAQLKELQAALAM